MMYTARLSKAPRVAKLAEVAKMAYVAKLAKEPSPPNRRTGRMFATTKGFRT